MSKRTRDIISHLLASLLIAGTAGYIVSWWNAPGWAVAMTVVLAYLVVIGRRQGSRRV